MKNTRRLPPATNMRPRRKGISRRGGMRPFVLVMMLAAGIFTLAAGSALFPAGFRHAAAAQSDQVGASAVPDSGISPSAAAQIEALAAEKRARTPAQRKIDTQLLYAAKMSRGESIASGVQSLSVSVARAEGDAGSVVVDISGDVGDSLLQTLRENGARVLVSTPHYNSLRAEVSLDRLEAVAASPAVRFIQSRQEGMTARSSAAGNDAPRGSTGPAPKTRAAQRSAAAAPFATRAARVREHLTSALARFREGKGDGPEVTPNVGARQSQGDVVHRADIARARYGVDGTGIRIGVISDGVINLSFAQASGDLPPDVTVLPGQAGRGDEGTAMLEIVHDIAPGAKLFFATADISLGNFADNIRRLRDAGCDIIVDDFLYFVETPFQDGQAPSIVSNTNGGLLTQAVNDVTASGSLYFSSAGNSGNLNDGTGGVFEGNFANGGTIALIGGAGAGPVHDFDPGAAVSQFDRITLGSGNPITLHWSDPLGASANDYDLYVLNAAGTALLAASTGAQDGTQDPFEAVGGGANVTNNRIVVAKFSGADRFLNLSTHRGRLQFATDGQIRGHSMAAEAYSVAATPSTPPFPNAYDATAKVETFSSDGPRRIFFQPDGTPYTPGNFLATGGTVRQKPDITASDGGVVSGAGGFPNPFFGTSASAPHAAAITALVKSGKPGITNAQVRAALNASAIDIEAPGVDRDSGVGIIMADTALQQAGAIPVALEVGTVTVAESAGNGNTFVEPGERGSLNVQLRNNTAATLTNVSATLTTSTPGVTIVPPGTSAYPDIPANGGTATNTTPFQFILASSVAVPTTIDFTLTVNATGAPNPLVVNFSVNLRRSVTVTTTLDANAPEPGEGFTAATGLQTGRLVRTAFGDNSSCGIVKANPGINAADATVPHRYDAYTFQNPSASPICVSVTLTTSAAQAGLLQSVAYAPTFNPTRVSDNYLGDIAGNQTNVGSRTYSFIVPANTSFVVVVNEITGGSPNGSGVAVPYTLTVDGLPAVTAVPQLVSLQFAQANQSVQEDASFVTLQVTRTGDTSLPVTVEYATADGTASGKTDYTDAVGTLIFPAGQNSANITVLLSEDSFVEGPETFTVTLTNPQGVEVGLGATQIATVQITDDAAEPATNAIDDPTVFVIQHYHDFLGRHPEASGLSAWVNVLQTCPNQFNNSATGPSIGCDRVFVSSAFFRSPEFTQEGYYAIRFYMAALGRDPSYQEFIRDLSRLNGATAAETEAARAAFPAEFLQRAEVSAIYDPLTNFQFVNRVQQTAGVTLPNRDQLVNDLDTGAKTRAQVLREIIEGQQVTNRFFNRGFVLSQYFGYLRRDPDTQGFNAWLAYLNANPSDFRTMVFGFVNSQEYRSRFGQP